MTSTRSNSAPLRNQCQYLEEHELRQHLKQAEQAMVSAIREDLLSKLSDKFGKLDRQLRDLNNNSVRCQAADRDVTREVTGELRAPRDRHNARGFSKRDFLAPRPKKNLAISAETHPLAPTSGEHRE
jgi:hypothetical protein